ncbi:preprotein translocase subunit SecE [Planctomicrobium piriforme]|uniref:Protein translocase subunit SecE n=1 Tax=Planctomicrobium piriforme TaxID=1576369 RepID=A0A1I3BB14_9PLAN|nr:preprotein translocase subunit SecE [Planctomicrobium piriforme]SFH58891.1 preprotein translocase subunit SecE [Planctomicrobium piriforme]
MAKAKAESSFAATLVQPRVFKPNQGRIVRQVTFAVVAGVFVIGAWRLHATILSDYASGVRWGVPTVVAVVGLWLAFALVNWPTFANFLISVEAEMDKVSWASLDYLKRATAVVLVTMLVLGAYLFFCDIFWQQLFGFIGFLDMSAPGS